MPRKITARIEELEKRHRYIADNLLDAIWVADAQTLKFDFITPSIEKISGYKAEEFKELTLQEQVTGESFKKIISVLENEKKRFDQGLKVTRTVELESVHKDGSTYWVEIRAKFMKEADGSLKIVGITKDISDQKKMEAYQENLIIQLSETLAEKEKLLKEIKVLEGLLPICSGCKRIRDEDERWWPLDLYVQEHTDAEITHTICPDCRDVFYGDLNRQRTSSDRS